MKGADRVNGTWVVELLDGDGWRLLGSGVDVERAFDLASDADFSGYPTVVYETADGEPEYPYEEYPLPADRRPNVRFTFRC
jgi:hypothetical protein